MTTHTGPYRRPLEVRLAIEYAKVLIHAPRTSRGFMRAVAITFGKPAFYDLTDDLTDALSEHLTLLPDDDLARAARRVLTGEDPRGRHASHDTLNVEGSL